MSQWREDDPRESVMTSSALTDIDFTTVVSPRSFGLSVYTDDDLRITGEALVGTNLYRGDGTDPAHILKVEVVHEGILAHCRTWREGDMAVNPETGSTSKVRRSVANGSLFAGFIEGNRYLGGRIQPCPPEDRAVLGGRG
jgi:hypothetical protein